MRCDAPIERNPKKRRSTPVQLWPSGQLQIEYTNSSSSRNRVHPRSSSSSKGSTQGKSLSYTTQKKTMLSSSTIRAFGSRLVRCSNRVSLKPSKSVSFYIFASRSLSSLAWYSSSGTWVSFYGLEHGNSVRKISTCTPLCMGRRSSKIAGRKTAQDLKKAKLYARFGKEVVSAVKKGGSSPVSNTALASLFEKAKDLDIPKDIIDRNIKRASEKGQEAYIEKFYEVYGYGGAGMIIQVLTDKVNRSVSAVREVVKDYGGKMADPGSIMFKFKRARIVSVKAADADRDHLLAVALDSVAEDVVEPLDDEDDSEEDLERYFKIVTSMDHWPDLLTKLRNEGISFETGVGFEFLPLSPIEVDDEAMQLNKELVSKLLELDDVDAVYTDQK